MSERNIAEREKYKCKSMVKFMFIFSMCLTYAPGVKRQTWLQNELTTNVPAGSASVCVCFCVIVCVCLCMREKEGQSEETETETKKERKR